MTDRRRARILIVDDSAVMRSLLRSVVTADQRLEVVGTASDGASALRAMESLRPDLILLDVEMPVMDGLVTLRAMKMQVRRVPVIMCSALTQRGAQVTIEALASGAADYVAKPSGQASREAAVQALAQDLIPKILALTGVGRPASRESVPFQQPPHFPGSLATPVASPLRTEGTPRASASVSTPSGPARAPSIVVIGLSTGGPAALDVLLPSIPATFPLPILVVQHMPELFTRLLAERLDLRCPLRVAEAVSGQSVRPGTIYIAKGNWHMEVTADTATPTLKLNQDPPQNHCRPAVDALFRSAVEVYGGRILAVILTGMGYDGLEGSRLVRQRGGMVLAQDEATSAVWGMPGAVAQAGLAQRILPLREIAFELVQLVQLTRLPGRRQREASELRESAV